MGERELQRRGLDRDLVALGKSLDPFDLGKDLWRRIRIFEVGFNRIEPVEMILGLSEVKPDGTLLAGR